ncbi:MAG TPA: glycosyltransferase family 39 protein [Candidatus Polarisedimenticolaceae bacterium]|nr:glycosyltransferase family 39 protein [Candidatus Polarisedimenticolaceae bacterium]
MTADGFRRPGLFLVLLATVLFLPRLGVRDLWSPDEPRFALIAEDMVRGGSWVAPQYLGYTYAEKPPLQLWAVALASLPAGRVDEASARLPSALAAIGSVLLTFVLGKRLLGPGAGLAGALVLLTSGHFAGRARWSCTDTLLVFFFVGSMVCARLWMDAPGRRWPAGLGFFACCGLATLTKGPVGLVLPAAILLAGLLLEGRWRELWRFPWVPGGVLYVALVAPWYVAYALEAGEGKLSTVLLRENVTRFLHAWNNVQPWYFYFGRFPLSFLPWAVFLPATVWALVRLARPEEKRALRWIALWFLVVFVFFSASSGKRTVYLLPLFPAVSLLVGWALWTALPRAGGAGARALRLSATPLLVLFALAAIAIPFLVGRTHASVRGPAWLVTVLLLLGAALLVGPLVRAEPRTFFARTVAVLVALLLLAEHVLLPRIDAYQNVRTAAARLAALVPPGARFGAAEPKREALFFYSGRRGAPIQSGEELARFLAANGPAYCVLPATYWDRWGVAQAVPHAVRALPPISDQHFLLVTNAARP